MYETYIGKTIGDHIHCFETRRIRFFLDLEEPFFYIYIMLSLKNNSRLESLET